MNRQRWAQLMLLAAALVGVRFVVPRLSRTPVRFELAAASCVAAATIEIRQAEQTARSLRVVPRPHHPTVYDTALHRGAYDVIVRLDCVDGTEQDGKARPIVISDEATIHLRAPGRCNCRP